jgi:hypothetical protein
MREQSVFSVQMAGKRSKEFGADELESLAEPVPRAQGICGSENWLKFARFACTVPTQPKIGTLSAIKTIGYRSFITRSG